MSVERCCIENCENEAIVSCSCSDQIFLCSNHIPIHNSTVEIHTFRGLLCSFNDELKPKVLNYLELELQVLKNKIKNLHTYSNTLINFIIKESKKIQKSLNVQVKHLNSLIKQINRNSNIHRFIFENILKNIKPENNIINLLIIYR